ncbi:MAG: restriction endonuclease subunit S [Methanothrix sp.]|nr:restriction endonuclease subunit S [Methanothrix sp.]MDD4448293.1 restriction endonuclease subunit S [Methanothrix sp.]
MANEWPIKTIAECSSANPYSTQIGPFGKALMADEYVESGVPVLRGVNVNRGRFHDDDFVFIDSETADSLYKFESFPGDVLLVHKGTLGKIGLMPTKRKYPRYIMGNSMMRVRCDPAKLLPEYLYYWLTSADGQHYLFSRVSQVGVPQIQMPLTTLRQAELHVPSLPEQRAITRILGTLDDKIELNRRMNETLEAIARTLFKSWFVDFDPVRARAEGRAPAGMDADTAALFPDSFEETELGMVPKGWRIGTVGKDYYLTMGQSPPGETYNEEMDGVPFYQGRTDFGNRYPSVRMYCNAPTRMANSGDTLISVRAPVGDINMASERCCIGRGLSAIRHKAGSRSFTYYMMCSLKEIFAQFEAEGTVFGSINKNDFKEIRCISPQEVIIKKFEDKMSPLDQMIENNEIESQTLCAIRDALLPKLLWNEVEIPVFLHV